MIGSRDRFLLRALRFTYLVWLIVVLSGTSRELVAFQWAPVIAITVVAFSPVRSVATFIVGVIVAFAIFVVGWVDNNSAIMLLGALASWICFGQAEVAGFKPNEPFRSGVDVGKPEI
jgi:hypothetical protein